MAVDERPQEARGERHRLQLAVAAVVQHLDVALAHGDRRVPLVAHDPGAARVIGVAVAEHDQRQIAGLDAQAIEVLGQRLRFIFGSRVEQDRPSTVDHVCVGDPQVEHLHARLSGVAGVMVTRLGPHAGSASAAHATTFKVVAARTRISYDERGRHESKPNGRWSLGQLAQARPSRSRWPRFSLALSPPARAADHNDPNGGELDLLRHRAVAADLYDLFGFPVEDASGRAGRPRAHVRRGPARGYARSGSALPRVPVAGRAVESGLKDDDGLEGCSSTSTR